MTKAKTAAARLKAKRGRPRKEGVLRTEEGRISRSNDAQSAEERLAVEAATWKRRQRFDKDGVPFIDATITPDEARKQEHGSVIHKWRLDYQRLSKKHPDGTHPNTFTALHLDTAERFHSVYLQYHAMIGATPPRSSSEMNRVPGGYDGADPFDGARARRDAKLTADYKEARRVILSAGPNCFMAVMAIVIENKDCPGMMGDLRLALNQLAVLWRLQSAA